MKIESTDGLRFEKFQCPKCSNTYSLWSKDGVYPDPPEPCAIPCMPERQRIKMCYGLETVNVSGRHKTGKK